MRRIGNCALACLSGNAGFVRRYVHIHLIGAFLIAVLSVAFATGTHSRPVLSAMDARLEAYLMTGGSMADLCLDGQDSHQKSSHCSLCYLVASSTLPRLDRLEIRLEQRIAATIILPQIRRAAANPRDPTTPKRGPPQIA